MRAKLLLSLLLLLATTIIKAQNFNYKKGIISIDKIGVAKMERIIKTEKKTEYIITDMQNNFLIKLKEFWIGYDAYYNLKFSDSTSTDMKYELMAFTLNLDKSIAMQLVKMYNLFDKNGFNKEAAMTMVEKNKNIKEAAMASAAAQKAVTDSLNKIIKQKNLSVGSDYSITSNGKKVGYIIAADNFNWGFDVIKIYNLNNELVGQSIPEQATINGKIKMNDGGQVNVKTVSWSDSFGKRSKLEELVTAIGSAGYF